MLQWCRTRARSIAATALVSLATLTIWSSAPHGHGDDCHDAFCVSAVVKHDPAAHSIGRDSSSTTERPLHCVLCHWTRIVRPSTGTAYNVPPTVERRVRFVVDVFSAPKFFSAAQPPLRAPPASPSLDV